MANVTTPKQITREEFLALFDSSVHAAIDRNINKPGTSGIICFENLQMDSSHFGERSAVIYGEHCSCTTLEDLSSKRLGDLPSTFKYPVSYYAKPLFDVVAVNYLTLEVHVLERNKTKESAEAVVRMAVMRRDIGKEFFTEVNAGAYKDGDTFNRGRE